jgi:hypothetical protein
MAASECELGVAHMRVMKLRSTVRRPPKKLAKNKSAPKRRSKMIFFHRLVPPREWHGFQLGDVIEAGDGFRWEYSGFEFGEPKRRIAKLIAAKTKIPPIVFHWRFRCEACGAGDMVRMGSSWRPMRRKCFTCNPAANWRQVEMRLNEEASAEAVDGGN